jgi:hypothetical protein
MLLLEGEALKNVYAEFRRVYLEHDRGLTLLEFVRSFIDNVRWVAMCHVAKSERCSRCALTVESWRLFNAQPKPCPASKRAALRSTSTRS